MMYPFLPVGLIAVFILVVLYLLFIRKNLKQMKAVLYPGLFFIGLWGVIYFFWMR